MRGAGVTLLFMLLALVDTLMYSSLFPKSSSSSSSTTPHQWVSGLSVVMGLYAFGLQGILLGPVLVYLTIILYRGLFLFFFFIFSSFFCLLFLANGENSFCGCNERPREEKFITGGCIKRHWQEGIFFLSS